MPADSSNAVSRDGSEPKGESGFDPRWLGATIPMSHWHFHRRLLERYGIVLAPGDFSKMVKDIKRGRALPLDRRSGGIIYAVEIASVARFAYVLMIGGHVATAWPPVAWLDAREEEMAEVMRLPLMRLVRRLPRAAGG